MCARVYDARKCEDRTVDKSPTVFVLCFSQ